MKIGFQNSLCFLLLGLGLLAFGGCKSAEPENMSSRPWNSPRGWEHGMPSMINEGR